MEEKTTIEIFEERIKHLPYYNQGRNYSDTFFIPRKTKNPLIRFLDWYCGMDDGMNPYVYVIYIVFIAGWIFGLFIPLAAWIIDSHCDFTKYCLCIGGITVWLWGWLFAMIFVVLRFDLVYRYFRNRYLVKHLLPGPYGWCSIDKSPWIYHESVIDDLLRVICRHEHIWQLYLK